MKINLESFTEKMSSLESKINYTFKNKDNLLLALTHSSFANEAREIGLESNERLEFLGDSVLNFIISGKLYHDYSGLSEGELTKIRASIVCETSLEKCSLKINLGQYLLLGKGEENTGGRTRTSILSDAFEALIGAVYLDGGIESARKFVLSMMEQIIECSIKGKMFKDYKTQLQEQLQKKNDVKIVYEVIDERGPDHDKVYVTQIKINDNVMGIGTGKSKKEAEQNAASQALKNGGFDE